MPWVVEDVDRFKKGLTDRQKRQWVAIANSALARCREEGGRDCERRAIIRANGAVEESRMAEEKELAALQEAVTIKAQCKQLLRQVKVLLANKGLPNAVRVALDDIEGALKKTWGDLESEAEPEQEPEPAPEPESAAAQESEITGDVVNLRERAVANDGTVTVKIIQPGWGSSGYYSPDVLKTHGPRVFVKGTKMFWDHQTATEEREQPEGSLDRLAGEFITDARWVENGADGPGLYADAKVFKRFADPVNELAPHIGVSIRAMGRAQEGERDGRRGPIITELTAARSVDFVTTPGAGGKVLQLFEAARAAQETIKVTEQEATELREANATLAAEVQRLQSALLAREAEAFARDVLAEIAMPAPTRARLLETWAAKPVLRDGRIDADGYRAAIEEAARVELDYLASVSDRGAIRGMGYTPQSEQRESLYEALKTMWLSLGKPEAEADRLAKIAAAGR